MKKVITIYSDPGHAWGKVLRSELKELGILDKISAFSYQRKCHVYLEEDCDLQLYVNALKDKGIELRFKESFTKGHRRSKIRSYDSFKVILD
jgi:hypothetical protein